MRRDDRRIALGLYRHSPTRELLEAALAAGVNDLDTAFNYHHFDSHRRLGAIAGDLLPRWEISTKVGFFPDGTGARHCLDPAMLRAAITSTMRDLGVAPEVVLLHNPERTLAALSRERGRDVLARACAVLAESVAAGWCRRWGLACWDPLPILSALHPEPPAWMPTPEVVMTRAGVTMHTRALRAAEDLARLWNLAPRARWGMSPFGGGTSSPVWTETDLTPLLRQNSRATTVSAAFRLAYELPSVTRVAIGVGSVAHLDELIAATSLEVNAQALTRYRRLLAEARS